MPSDIPWVSLEDLVDDIVDRRGVTPLKLGGQFTNSGHRVISAKLLKGGRVDLEADEPRFVSPAIYAKWMKGPLLPGDVLMTSEAPLGELAFVNSKLDWCLGQRLFAIRPNAARLDGRYAFYALQTRQVREDLVGRSTGTTVQGIRQSELRRVRLPVPHLSQQVAAANVLTVLDDRIALLRETNATLEAIAKALFKSWFVDFDPVRAKQQGLAPAGMDEATAAFFPKGFEEATPIRCPAGWQVGTVKDLLDLAYGKAMRATDRVVGSVPVYGSGGLTGFHNEPLIQGPTVIVGRKGTVGSLYWEDRPCFPIDTVFYVRSKVPLSFCYYQLDVLGLRGMNTDGAVPGLNRDNVYRLPVVCPPNALLDAFDDVTGTLRERVFANQQQAETLTILRDTLLPRLISGQLRLPEAEAETLSALG